MPGMQERALGTGAVRAGGPPGGTKITPPQQPTAPLLTAPELQARRAIKAGRGSAIYQGSRSTALVMPGLMPGPGESFHRQEPPCPPRQLLQGPPTREQGSAGPRLQRSPCPSVASQRPTSELKTTPPQPGSGFSSLGD